jgi:hypothetical protein
MSFTSATAPFEPSRVEIRSKGSSRLVKRLCDAGLFIRNLRVHLRFGELTRAPLRLLRFQVAESLVECDWVARSADPWDSDLPHGVGHRHASLQALQDAIEIRNLLFQCLPEANRAVLRGYRHSAHRGNELIIAGSSDRNDVPARSIRSVAMRAQMMGLRFSLENGVLNKISGEAHLRVGT